MTFLRESTKGYALKIDALRDLMVNDDVTFMLAGHTHERMVREFQGLVVVNAGTLRRGNDPGFVVVDFDASTVRFFDVSESDGSVRPAEAMALPIPTPVPGLEADEEHNEDWW